MSHIPPLPNTDTGRLMQQVAALSARLDRRESQWRLLPYTSGNASGGMTINTKSPTRLTSVSELVGIPPGTYLFGMTIFMQQKVEGVGSMSTALCNSANSAGMFISPFIYSVARGTADGGYFSSVFRGTLTETISFVPYCWCDFSTEFVNAQMWAMPCN